MLTEITVMRAPSMKATIFIWARGYLNNPAPGARAIHACPASFRGVADHPAMKPGALAPFTLALLGLLPLRAAESLPKPVMTECGRLLCGDDLSAIDAKAWRVAKGKWEIAGGALKGVELEADDHAAAIRRQLSFKDAVIQFDVRIDGCKQTAFSVNEAKAHLARVLFTPAGFTAQKDDRDRTGPDKAERFGTVARPFKPGEWHTVLVEFMGEEMVATVDGRSIAGSSPALLAPKANFGFTVVGESASYRNLRVWEAKPNPAWESNRRRIPSSARRGGS